MKRFNKNYIHCSHRFIQQTNIWDNRWSAWLVQTNGHGAFWMLSLPGYHWLVHLEALLVSYSWFMRQQHCWSSEHVTEWIVDQVQEGSGVQIGVSDDLKLYCTLWRSLVFWIYFNYLTREESLARSRTEEWAHHAIRKIHFVCDITNWGANLRYIRFLFGARVQVSERILILLVTYSWMSFYELTCTNLPASHPAAEAQRTTDTCLSIHAIPVLALEQLRKCASLLSSYS